MRMYVRLPLRLRNTKVLLFECGSEICPKDVRPVYQRSQFIARFVMRLMRERSLRQRRGATEWLNDLGVCSRPRRTILDRVTRCT